MPADKFEKLGEFEEFMEELANTMSNRSNPVTKLTRQQVQRIAALHNYISGQLHLCPKDFAKDERLVKVGSYATVLLGLKSSRGIDYDETTANFLKFIIDLVNDFRPYVLKTFNTD